MEEDDLYNKDYVELDEVYTYSQIESIEITESRKRPASIAKVSFIDPHGILSGFNQWSKAANPLFTSNRYKGREAQTYSQDTESSSPFLRGTKYEQSDINFRLQAGLKIKICLGFSNDVNKLQEVFLGEISDISMDGSSDRIEIICTGYGAELVAKTKGLTEDEAEVTYDDTFDLLAHLMFEPEVLHFGKKKFNSITMFGEDQSIKENEIQFKETFAIGGMINAQKTGGWPAYAWFVSALEPFSIAQGIGDWWDEAWRNQAKILTIEPFTGPQDDNIFAPNYLPIQGYYWYDYFERWAGKISKDGDMRIVALNPDGSDPLSAAGVGSIIGTGVAVA
ncbi:MAG: hypothetical protein EB127_31575, partial [Alphaproteobacteria bacterium]|nr:hypothetical protein [Alphaproteobacteria bacterium]